MSKYNHIPRPNVESHYHIQELIERQEVRAADRIYHQQKDKNNAVVMSDIKAAAAKEVKEFWCDQCRLDFFAEAFKEVETDWNNSTNYIAFYRSKCHKGHWCIRLITDRFKDSFFFRSRKVARDRGMYFAEVVQPHETNYQLLYGRKNKS